MAGYTDSFNMSWNVELKIKNKYGKILTTRRGHNDVLIKGRESVALLLPSGDDNKKITKIGFGDAGHDPGSPTEPLPVDESGGAITNLNNRLLIKALDSYTNPTPTSVKFVGTLLDVELIGTELSEIGLFTEDETIFATFRFGQTFHGSVIFEYSWEISIG